MDRLEPYLQAVSTAVRSSSEPDQRGENQREGMNRIIFKVSLLVYIFINAKHVRNIWVAVRLHTKDLTNILETTIVHVFKSNLKYFF